MIIARNVRNVLRYIVYYIIQQITFITRQSGIVGCESWGGRRQLNVCVCVCAFVLLSSVYIIYIYILYILVHVAVSGGCVHNRS